AAHAGRVPAHLELVVAVGEFAVTECATGAAYGRVRAPGSPTAAAGLLALAYRVVACPGRCVPAQGELAVHGLRGARREVRRFRGLDLHFGRDRRVAARAIGVVGANAVLVDATNVWAGRAGARNAVRFRAPATVLVLLEIEVCGACRAVPADGVAAVLCRCRNGQGRYDRRDAHAEVRPRF